ncbi:hypothetical protein T484DRAFT_1814171 [Baffinella frigidus]|nr:hypothetical protein T484DRAFT_1814171 [Cryptophyta sp. CCMP2293]
MLRRVDLRGTSVGEQGVIMLCKRAPALETLLLSNCDAVSDVAVVRGVLRCKGLSSLQLRGCTRLGPEAFEAIALHSAFSSLDLSGLERLTDATAARIAKTSTSLRLLNLSKSLNLSKCPLVGSSAVWHLGPSIQVTLPT